MITERLFLNEMQMWTRSVTLFWWLSGKNTHTHTHGGGGVLNTPLHTLLTAIFIHHLYLSHFLGCESSLCLKPADVIHPRWLWQPVPHTLFPRCEVQRPHHPLVVLIILWKQHQAGAGNIYCVYAREFYSASEPLILALLKPIRLKLVIIHWHIAESLIEVTVTMHY